MPTAHFRGAPSRRSLTLHRRVLLIAGGAVLCLVIAPAEAVAATVVTTPSASPSPSPTCVPTPCVNPAAPQLTLTQALDKPTAAIGDTVTYTVTLGNTGSVPAPAVTVDDLLGGSAGFLAEDGTGGTADTFVGSPLTTITRVVTGHYRWSYVSVSPGDSDLVRFSAILTAGSATGQVSQVIALTSTASTPGAPSVTVSTTATQRAPAVRGGGVRSGGGSGIKGASTGVPATGSGLAAAVAGCLFLGGLGLILLGVLLRRRDQLAV